MVRLELISDHDCPNVARARDHVRRAFAEAGVHPSWQEWDRSDPAAPAYVRCYGSPTVLVDGRDVAGVEPVEEASCCRLYAGRSGQLHGVPAVADIASALRLSKARKSRWWSTLAILPGIGASLLPVGLCPACWPAYGGLLSALGLGFLLNTIYLLPVTGVFVLLAVGALGFRARERRGYGPFLVGLPASGIVLFGKFLLESNAALYGGLALLVAVSVWNAWPRQAAAVRGDSCPACAPEGQASRSEEPGATERGGESSWQSR